MFEHFTTPEDIFYYKLGAAVTMERDSVELLGYLEEKAKRSELKDLLLVHAHETRQQIENLTQCFSLLNDVVHAQPSPATKGLAKEAKSATAKTADSLLDAIVLSAALENGHYEQAVYETLVAHAQSLGIAAVGELLDQNLGQEKAAIEKIVVATKMILRDGIAVALPKPESQDPISAPPYLPPSAM